MALGEHLNAFFHCRLLKICGGDGSMARDLAKNKFFTDMLGLLSP
jgi:hypothetical protein